MKTFPVELKLLIDAACWQINKSDHTYHAFDFDEELLFNLGVRHSLLAWFLPYAKEFSVGSQELQHRIVSFLLKAGIKHQLQTLELIKLSSLFKEHNIEYLILKGVTIEKQFYQGFIDSRYSDDIDILISPADLGKASQLLLTENYQQRDSSDLTRLSYFIEQYEVWFRWRDVGFKKQSMGKECIDLHWRIADNFTIPSKTKELLKQHMVIQVNGESIASLPFSNLFVHVCVHGYIDFFFRLRHLIDVYTAMQQPEFNLNEISEVAEAWGVLDKVLASMATAEDFFSDKMSYIPGSESTSSDSYVRLVRQRFIDANGLPLRSHPNNAEWSLKDKLLHLINQIKFRSDNAWFFAPLLARCKYNHEMLLQWSPNDGALVTYPLAIAKRCFKPFKGLLDKRIR